MGVGATVASAVERPVVGAAGGGTGRIVFTGAPDASGVVTSSVGAATTGV
ncbi:hypothetical protein [Actinomadura sp. HBU206391]|nr:hypothetical protein [Actinomadura sp. HBU206391]MBC6460228.1 hypothetical protein [Actinomadura sp. HBU206391]